jgi:hypothetical protein
MEKTPQQKEMSINQGDAASPESQNPLLSRRELLRKGSSKALVGVAAGFLGLGLVGNSQKKADALCICACCTGCTGGCFGCTSCTWICSTCTGCTSCTGCQGCTTYCMVASGGCGNGVCNATCGDGVCDQTSGPGRASATVTPSVPNQTGIA